MTTSTPVTMRIPARSKAIELFVDLSAVLTGFSPTELWGTGVVDTYYDEVNLIIGERELGKLLGRAAQAIPNPKKFEKRILDDSRFGPVARNIIRLWYLGAWQQLPAEWRNVYGATAFDHDHIVSAQTYAEGLVWVAADAHPMGAKQQGFGAWAIDLDPTEATS